MNTKGSAKDNSGPKKAWNKPQLRAVVPASHTRGGLFPNSPLDDTFYRIS